MTKEASPVPGRVALEKRRQVLERTGLSNTWMYELIKAGKFPAPVRISSSPNSVAWVAWVSEEVDAWIEERIAERNAMKQANKGQGHEAIRT